jgi:hypothetical protein
MSDTLAEHTPLEERALFMAQLILSYSPESLWANQSPTMYAMMYNEAYKVMKAVGIEPEVNIRCWFWQLDEYVTGRNHKKYLREVRMKSAPRLHLGLVHWLHPDRDERLSDAEFVQLWRN